ncbi:UNVERIFIED_CONTAM: hypothetical protein Sangu_0141700 [Sesamum angustifolium]|uniref:SWIM-type domain-containing protein n=1 Tax=Sesamum angustifolium TaxID=2727405 RepID=A0AAW2RL95_9LAMI
MSTVTSSHECHCGRPAVIYLGSKSCSCRKWQLSGIPCKHACCAIYHQKQDPKDYVADCYSVDTYRRVYKPAILPMSHEGMWSESCIIPPIPPNFGRRAGRPAKARRRESDEPTLKNKKKSKRKQVQKIKRHQTTVHCRTCGEPGHNTAKCPEKSSTCNAGATINMEGTSVRAGKRKAPTNAVNRIERDRDTSTGTQGANILRNL